MIYLRAGIFLVCGLSVGCSSSRLQEDGGGSDAGGARPIDSGPIDSGLIATDTGAPLVDSGPIWTDAGTADSGVDAGAVGQPCESNGDCASGMCRTVFGRDGLTSAICTVDCSLDGAGPEACPSGSSCFVPGAVAGFCLADCGDGCRPGFACEAETCVPADCPRPAPGPIGGIYRCCWDDGDCNDSFRCHRSTCGDGGEGRCVEDVRRSPGTCWEDADCWGDQRCVGGELFDLACDDGFDLPGRIGNCE